MYTNRAIEQIKYCEDCKKVKMAEHKFRCLRCNKIVCEKCFHENHNHPYLHGNDAVTRQVNAIQNEIAQRELDNRNRAK